MRKMMLVAMSMMVFASCAVESADEDPREGEADVKSGEDKVDAVPTDDPTNPRGACRTSFDCGLEGFSCDLVTGECFAIEQELPQVMGACATNADCIIGYGCDSLRKRCIKYPF